ncbi:MAG: NosD domain-containing protein [Candidatus Hermodarchaeota archaeon]
MGIILVLSPNFNIDLNFNEGNKDKLNLDNENLKSSEISGKIFISENSGWLNFKNAGRCTGNGSSSDPYVIEDLVINASGSGSCIIIEYSDVYFRIENCTLFNSGSLEINAGIKLRYVINGKIINNTSYNNRRGIYITYSDNNTFIGNTLIDDHYAIYLEYSFNNLLYLNNFIGIQHNVDFIYSTNIFNSQKKMIYTYQGNNYTNYMGNYWHGFHRSYDNNNDGVWDSRYQVRGFETEYVLYDNYPLVEPTWNYEIHRIIESSEDLANGGGVPGYNLLVLIGIFCTTSIIFYKKLKKSIN